MPKPSTTGRSGQVRTHNVTSDRGVIAVLFALLVGVLILPVCAFCLDLANLRMGADQLQDNVRSAAVTGVFEYQAGSTLTATQQSVANVLLANDITANVACPPTCAATSGSSNACKAIKVTITQAIPTTFAGIFGLKQLSFTRSATAIYHKQTSYGLCTPNAGTSAAFKTDTVETIG